MRVIDDAHVEAATCALLGAIDAGDRGTDEQRGVLAAMVSGYWERPDLDLDALVPLEPEAVAAVFPDALTPAAPPGVHGAAGDLPPSLTTRRSPGSMRTPAH